MATISTAAAMEYKPTSPLAAGSDDLSGQTILQVIPALDTGGAERTTLEVGRAIIAAGGRSLVISSGGRMVEQLEKEGSRHWVLPVASKNPLTLWRNRGIIQRMIADEDVTHVHARSRAPAWSAFWAARATGTPFVTTYHGIYRAKSQMKKLYNSVMARGDAVIANSHFTAETVREAYAGSPFFDAETMAVIPRGADLARFDPERVAEADRNAAFSAFGGQDAFRILLPGRLTEWKGQGILIEAAKLLQGLQPNVSFRVVLVGSAQGRDNYESALRAQIEEAGLSDKVHLQGHWDDMPSAYDWADVTVSASTRPEAFGRVSVEAQAMGCPVIASAHGGSMETVEDGVTGYLVPPADPAALAQALARLSDQSPSARSAMVTAAKTRITEQFSVEAMTNATLSVYKSLTREAGPRRPHLEQ